MNHSQRNFLINHYKVYSLRLLKERYCDLEEEKQIIKHLLDIKINGNPYILKK